MSSDPTGVHIRAARALLEINQTPLAVHAGLSRAIISDIEQRASLPSRSGSHAFSALERLSVSVTGEGVAYERRE